MRAHLGSKAAIMATAHTIACILCHRLTHRTPFRDRSAEDYEQPTQGRDSVPLRIKAATLGLPLVESRA
jgi:hypothetical protein